MEWTLHTVWQRWWWWWWRLWVVVVVVVVGQLVLQVVEPPEPGVHRLRRWNTATPAVPERSEI